jgi:motility quorum-sensing regulator / GCU-specific mRNA interferase toxin
MVASVIEKRRPTYDLEAIKLAIGSLEALAITTTACATRRSSVSTAVGSSRQSPESSKTIAIVERRMFFKSMTTFADSHVWQDVYHVPARGLTLYVKFQADVVAEFRVMSFKEK